MFLAFQNGLKNMQTSGYNGPRTVHIAIHKYVYQLKGVFCNRPNLCSTADLNWGTGQNKGRYCQKELSFLFVLLHQSLDL